MPNQNYTSQFGGMQGMQQGIQGMQQQGMQQQGMLQQHGAGTAQWGAHEAMEIHEVLTDTIDAINIYQLYRPHIKDQQLQSIADRHLQFMTNEYQNLVNHVHNKGMHAAEPYRPVRTSGVKYGLNQPAPMQPNTNPNELDDRDIASGMLGINKASALVSTAAALECADPTLRQMISNCTQSCINKAYEVFQFMNQKGYYQVPTMMQKTTQTWANSYQQPQHGTMMGNMGGIGGMQFQ